jgi:hypothetical protein
MFWCVDINFYRHWFNVDTSDVACRLKAAVNPMSSESFLEMVHARPDFYGPFWVANTLVLLIAFMSNLSSWLSASPESIWAYDFSAVTTAAGSLYIYNLLLAGIIWGWCRQLEVPDVNFAACVCVVGYTLSVYAPVVLVCALPINAWQWVVVMAAGALFLWNVLGSVWPKLQDHVDEQGRRTVALSLLVVHALASVGFKLSFFSF